MSPSQGTYVQIEQTSEAIRVTYEMCRGVELRTAELEQRKYTFLLAKHPFYSEIRLQFAKAVSC